MKKGPNLDSVFEKLGKLPQLYRIIIAVVLLLIPVGLFVWLSFMPQLEEIKKLGENLKKLETELKEATKKASELVSVREEMKKAEEKFAIAKKKLPENQDMPEVLKGISTSGRDSGMAFSEFKPIKGKAKSDDFFEEIPISISVSGGYHGFLTFCDMVSKMPRIVSIKDISMAPEKKGDAQIATKCTAVTYQFVGERPAAKKPAKSKSKGKKPEKKKGGH